MGNQPSSTIDPSADTATRRDSTDSMSNQGSASAPSRAANARKGKLKPSTSVTRPSAQTSSTVSRVRNSVLRRLSPSASSTVNTLSGTRSAQNTMVEVTARSANTTDVSPSVTLALLPSEITNSETAWNRHSAAIEDAADVHHNGLDDDAPFIEIPASASAQENLQAHIDISTMTETGRSTVVTDAISESRLPNATNDADYTIPIRLDISIEDLLISSLIPVEEGAMALSLEDEFRIVGVNASELVRAELSNAEAEMRYTQTNRQNPVPSVDAFVAGHSLVQKSISLVGERRPVEDARVRYVYFCMSP
ncbi:hypothetical protein BC830DRAFT_745542 [Chytriomyces sp. MP71]|nr:hypothetical protein BC830DRAFT_745542 [Chytriomyces sp. MP71]